MSACHLWRPAPNLILPWIDGSYTTLWKMTPTLALACRLAKGSQPFSITYAFGSLLLLRSRLAVSHVVESGRSAYVALR
jgi:hypothetical protein